MGELNGLGKAIKKWLSGKHLYGMEDDYAQGENAVVRWDSQMSNYPELAGLAMFLLDCPVQAATCERIFKEYSRFHTKRRANLQNSTAFRMTQVKRAVRDKYQQ